MNVESAQSQILVEHFQHLAESVFLVIQTVLDKKNGPSTGCW